MSYHRETNRHQTNRRLFARLLVSTLVVLGILGIYPLPASAAGTYYVGPAGNDTFPGTFTQPFRTLQKALDAVQPGETIKLASGVYQEAVQTVRPGTASARITIEPDGGSQPVLEGGNTLIVMIIGHSYYTVRNLEIRNAKVGARIEYATGVIFENNRIHHTANEGMKIHFLSNNNTIRNNTIWTTGINGNAEGIYVGTAPEQRSRYLGQPDVCTGNIISGNEMYDVGEGIDIKEDSSFNIVSDNIIHESRDPSSGGISSRGDSNYFYNNIAYNGVGAGFRFGGDITYSPIYGNNYHYGVNNVLRNNIVRNNAGYGYKFMHGPQDADTSNTGSGNGGVLYHYGAGVTPFVTTTQASPSTPPPSTPPPSTPPPSTPPPSTPPPSTPPPSTPPPSTPPPSTPPPAPAPTGGGGGLALPVAPPATTPVALSGLVSDSPLLISNTGKVQNAAALRDSGRTVSVNVPAGTVIKTGTESVADTLSLTTEISTPAPPVNTAVIVTKELGPSGITFDPPVTLTLTYTEVGLPAGVVETELVLAFWDGGKWVDLESMVDAATNTISAQVSHFTLFGVLAPLPPPPAISILTPRAGAELRPGGITVAVSIQNFFVVTAGGIPARGQGHLHYYLDTTIPTVPGAPVVAPEGRYYKESTETSVLWKSLPPGVHTFGVQLVNNDHTPFEPPVTAELTVNIPAPPPAEPVSAIEGVTAPGATAVIAPLAAAEPVSLPVPDPAPAPAAPRASSNWGLTIGWMGATVVLASLAVFLIRKKQDR